HQRPGHQRAERRDDQDRRHDRGDRRVADVQLLLQRRDLTGERDQREALRAERHEQRAARPPQGHVHTAHTAHDSPSSMEGQRKSRARPLERGAAKNVTTGSGFLGATLSRRHFFSAPPYPGAAEPIPNGDSAAEQPRPPPRPRGADAASGRVTTGEGGARIVGLMRGGKRRAGSAAALLALVVAGPLALTACSGGNGGSSVSSSAREQGGAAAGQAQAPESLKQDSAAGTSPGSSSGSASTATGTGTAVKLPSRDLVITVGLQVKTSDAAAAAAKAQSIVQAAGGYVANEAVGSGQQVVTPQPAQSSGSADGGTTPAPATLPDINDASDSTQ